MSDIVLLSGSPHISSRSSRVLEHVGSLLEEASFSVSHISVQIVPLEDLFYGKFDSPVIKNIASQIEQSKGVVIGSPVYKAAYTGLLKSLIDILPQDIFESKPVFPIMTGGSPAHLLAIEYTLKPLISILKGHSLRGVYILDKQIKKEGQNPIIDEGINQRINQHIKDFTDVIKKQ